MLTLASGESQEREREREELSFEPAKQHIHLTSVCTHTRTQFRTLSLSPLNCHLNCSLIEGPAIRQELERGEEHSTALVQFSCRISFEFESCKQIASSVGQSIEAGDLHDDHEESGSAVLPILWRCVELQNGDRNEKSKEKKKKKNEQNLRLIAQNLADYNLLIRFRSQKRKIIYEIRKKERHTQKPANQSLPESLNQLRMTTS